MYYTLTFLWIGLRDALTYRWNKSLRVNLILCPFSKVILVGSSIGPIDCLVTGSLPQKWCQIWASIYEVGLKFNHRVISYSHDICATIISLGISGQAGHYCSSQSSQLGKANDYFSPPIVCTAFQHHKSYPVGMRHPVSTSVISPCSPTHINGLMRDRVLWASSGD